MTQDEHEVLLPQCLHYDISDAQTTSCQTESASDRNDVGTQTVTLKKVRKGRCHGRASQTDSSFTSSSTWERLPLETIIAAPQYAEENGLHVDAIAEDIDTNDVVRDDHADAVTSSCMTWESRMDEKMDAILAKYLDK